MKRTLFALAIFSTLTGPVFGQFKNGTPSGEAPGLWINATIGVGKQADGSMKSTALKGLAIKVGDSGEAAVAYDTDLCRIAGAWTGKFVTPMNLMSRGEFPTAQGDVAFTTSEMPGFGIGAGEPKDTRVEPFGPLPAGQAKFKGFYVHGSKVLLAWTIAGTELLEMPAYFKMGDAGVFTRAFEIAPHAQPFSLRVAAEGAAVRLKGSAKFTHSDAWVTIEPSALKTTLTMAYLSDAAARSLVDNAAFNLEALIPTPAGIAFKKGGPAHWPESVETQGEVSTDTASAYVVDTVKLPDPNPWNAPMFVGGFDFFPDGRVAICTFHGDVFIGSGIDGDLKKVTWKRFASGLYHALGLKIVGNEIYVTGRDGITRLRDLNGDGEADFYEAFNHDVMVTKSFHEFVFDLQTDPKGNFYFAKAGPVKNGGRGFDQIVAHHGSLFKVSADGAKFDVVATGFRAPNGIGCGPDGQLTSGDNEGTWTPVCRINWIKPGGFYGVVDLAHRETPPTDYDRPLCWMPKRADNSSGDQVWVTSDKWGPWKDQMLHLSYGTCSLFGVLKEEVNGQMQGGIVQFPTKFQSGTMRARFNPIDGQLYVAGLRGWQTTGLKNGCLQRVRFTGAPVRMPVALHAKKNGIELTFSSDVDTKAAADPENYNVEVWNYIWSSAYGSPEISTLGEAEKAGDVGKTGTPEFSKAQMGKTGHDALTVKSVSISTDERTVFLEIPGLKPVMQMSLKYTLKAADGAPLEGEVLNTIHNLGAE